MATTRGILFRGDGDFSEFVVQGKGDARQEAVAQLLGTDTVAMAPASRFNAPFAVLVGGSGTPTALVVDPDSAGYATVLHGPAALFRRSGSGGIAAIRHGDIDLVRTLPWWLRLDRLERRDGGIPQASAGFTPQFCRMLVGTMPQRAVFVGAMLARFEHDIISARVESGFAATYFELQLADDDAVRLVEAFIGSALDSDGMFDGAWR